MGESMSFIYRIKEFFRRIFSRNMVVHERLPLNNDSNNNNENSFFSELKKDAKDHSNKRQIIEEINRNPDLIYSLSYTRLVQLNELYEERISELENELKTMQG